MFKIHREELDWAGRKLVLETGKIARQADGAVFATYGESTVLATVVSAKEPKAGIDFLPLTCNYQEKTYAAGRIPGGYFKREGRPTEKETLVSRLIDRPIRPLFADGYRCDTQVIVTTLSHDLENDPDIVAMVAASVTAGKVSISTNTASAASLACSGVSATTTATGSPTKRTLSVVRIGCAGFGMSPPSRILNDIPDGILPNPASIRSRRRAGSIQS